MQLKPDDTATLFKFVLLLDEQTKLTLLIQRRMNTDPLRYKQLSTTLNHLTRHALGE